MKITYHIADYILNWIGSDLLRGTNTQTSISHLMWNSTIQNHIISHSIISQHNYYTYIPEAIGNNGLPRTLSTSKSDVMIDGGS